MRKINSFMAVALTVAAALVVFVGVPAEAFAATPDMASHVIGSLGDVAVHYAPHMAATLAVLRADLSALEKRATDKQAEAKDGMDQAAIRKIEAEHAAIGEEIKAKKDEIAAEERRLAAEEDAARRNPPAPVVDQAAINAAATAAAQEATRAERQRTATIRTLADTAGFSTFAQRHIDEGTSIDAFRSALLDHMVSAEGQTAIRSNTRIEVGRGNNEQRAAAITNALMHRHDPVGVELTEAGRNYRGMTLIEISRDVLEAHGISTRGMNRTEIAAQALAVRSGGMHTTSDFGGILSNVANTTLRAAYQAAPQTFRPLVRETSVSDFKAVTRAQMGEAPALNKVNEHGEFKRGTLGEGSETYRIATYGKIVAITRQVIINDDLDAFTRLPAAFGVQAAQLESDLVWAQILSNPLMGDKNALFHAKHGNLLTAAGITVDSLSAGRVTFAKQTGLDGKTVLGLTPTYIITPVALQTDAEKVIGQIVAAKTGDVVPESIKKLQIISEGRLDVGINRPEDDIVVAAAPGAWYMAGNLQQTDIVELAYLEGNRGVYTETRTGFDIDGVEVKARLDVGAKAMDWRNIAKNPGL